jgi:multidrug resistance efflux pump
MTLISSIQWERRPNGAPTAITGALLLIVLAAGWWASTTHVQIYALSQGSLQPQGELRMIDSSVTARVTRMAVKPWQHVKRGQVLFVLDATGADGRDGQLQLAGLTAQLEEARRDLNLADSVRREQIRQVRLLEPLYAVGAIARVELETARVKLEQARFGRDRAGSRVEANRLQLVSLTRKRELEVRATVDGIISKLGVQGASQVVMAGARLAEVLPDGVPLEFRALLVESERPKVQLGARAEISWNGYPRSQHGVTSGRVVGISPTTNLVGPGEKQANVFEVRIQPESLLIPRSNGKRALPGLAGEARVIAVQKSVMWLAWDWLRGIIPS